jgi:peptidyl-prolyl cis-trans isomerase SurA
VNLTLSILLFCTLIHSSTGHAKTLVDRIEAVVNKTLIFNSSIKDFRTQLGLRMKIDPLYSISPMAKKGPNITDQEILDARIQEELVLEKFPVSDAEVEQRVQDFQNSLKIDRASLTELLRREGFSFETYFQMMRIALAKQTLVERELRSKSVVPDEELKAAYFSKSGEQGAKFRGTLQVMLLAEPTESFKSVDASKEFFAAERKLMLDGTPSDSWIDLGHIAIREMTPKLLEVTRKLKVGDVSEPYEDNNRINIVKVVDIKTDDDPEFDRERETLRAEMMQVEIQRQFDLWTERQKSTVSIRRMTKPV